MRANQVVVEVGNSFEYPSPEFYFRPSNQYPEYIFKSDLSPKPNNAYELVRSALIEGGFDKDNIGLNSWNPLHNIVSPGDVVLIKPNFVMDNNPSGDGTECLTTHPSVIAAVVDYVLIAFKEKRGKIIIGDAPMQECRFDELIDKTGLGVLVKYYKDKGVDISLVDFRGLKSTIVRGLYHSTIDERKKGTIIDLGTQSEFYGDNNEYKKLRITNYNTEELLKHHNEQKHEYYIANDVLAADVIINMPKPKTHRKAGITASLKNMVGINVRKEYLPHHTKGCKERDVGDEYKGNNDLKRFYSWLKDHEWNYSSQRFFFRSFCIKVASFFLKKILLVFSKDKYFEGSWYGNDTISKTVVDLNKIVFFADKNGIIRNTKQRKMLIVADMIISGEKEGPIEPSKKEVGIIAIGQDPVLFDEGIAMLMGVHPKDIPTIVRAKNNTGTIVLSDAKEKSEYLSNNANWNKKNYNELLHGETLLYYPSTGWKPVFFITKCEK